MTLFILDTDILSLLERGHPSVIRNIVQHASDRATATVTTVEEQFLGWQRRISSTKSDAAREQYYVRFAQTIENLSGLEVLPHTAGLLQRHRALVRMKLNVGTNDLKIAAIALESKGVVVTRNRRDFSRVPTLMLEDWSV